MSDPLSSRDNVTLRNPREDTVDMAIKPTQAAIIALPVVGVAALIYAANTVANMPIDERIAVGSVPAPKASSTECADLIAALPDQLGDFTAGELVEPAPPATKAWASPSGGEPIVLRCGIDRPGDFNAASPLQDITVEGAAVTWFRVADADMGAASWFAVDRPVYVALTIPDDADAAVAVQDVTQVIGQTLPRTEINPAPL
jgi:hypothetical protein